MIPTRDGPARKPSKPPVATADIPLTALTPGTLVAVLKSTGTTQENPSPTSVNPAIATGIEVKLTASR